MAYRFKHGDRPLDDYTIQRAVGSGGFGEVYYSVSDGGREVALKYLRQNPEVELRGVSHCINLKSPHLVSIFDVKKNADGDYFIIMEYCSGPSLRDLLIAEPDGFKPEKAAFFVRELAKGLAYLHDRGIVHRDLKPGNIFYDDGYVKIGDYGLSKFIAVSRHSAQTASVGTVHYMAPEIGSGDYSRGVDIYALGVMLYEMLLGKVPFEGSSMAEILMKHLTAQPEVEALPEPFGRIIRKALQKDPKDRYQNVNEMVDDLLAVEDVQKSLAGFSPQSLDGAVAGAGRGHADEPIPSPNPVPRRGGRPDAWGGGRGTDVPARKADVPFSQPLTRRMQRIAKRMDKRMAQLAKRNPLPAAAGAHATPRADRPEARGRGRSLLPAIILTLGLAIGVGVLFAVKYNSEAVGVAAGMLTVLLGAGVALSRKAAGWFGVSDGPRWAGSIVRIVACAPLLFLGAAPMLDSTRYFDPALAVVLGLLVVALFGDWDRTWEGGKRGELDIWNAAWKGCGAAVVAAIAVLFGSVYSDGELPFFLAGTTACAGALVAQANAWWLAGSRRRRRSPKDHDPGFPEDRDGEFAAGAEAAAATDDGLPPFAYPVGDPRGRHGRRRGGGTHKSPDAPAEVRHRLWITRAFWSVAAFVLMGGTVTGFLIPLIVDDLDYTDATGSIIACISCASLMIFALRKTTMVKRPGFWRDTVRPLVIALAMAGIGGTITGIAREWESASAHSIATTLTADGFGVFAARTSSAGIDDDAKVALIVGLVLCSILFLGVTLFTGGKPRSPKPFLRNLDDEPAEPRDAPRSQRAAPTHLQEGGAALLPHRGAAILVFGLLGFPLLLFPFGIVAWVMANNDLERMLAGTMSPEGRGSTNVGKVLGVISVVITCLVVPLGLFALLFAAAF